MSVQAAVIVLAVSLRVRSASCDDGADGRQAASVRLDCRSDLLTLLQAETRDDAPIGVCTTDPLDQAPLVLVLLHHLERLSDLDTEFIRERGHEGVRDRHHAGKPRRVALGGIDTRHRRGRAALQEGRHHGSRAGGAHDRLPGHVNHQCGGRQRDVEWGRGRATTEARGREGGGWIRHVRRGRRLHVQCELGFRPLGSLVDKECRRGLGLAFGVAGEPVQALGNPLRAGSCRGRREYSASLLHLPLDVTPEVVSLVIVTRRGGTRVQGTGCELGTNFVAPPDADSPGDKAYGIFRITINVSATVDSLKISTPITTTT